MTQQTPLIVKPGDLPLRVVLLVPEGNVQRHVAYLLRVTRSGGLLLNKDELAKAVAEVPGRETRSDAAGKAARAPQPAGGGGPQRADVSRLPPGKQAA